MSYVHLVEATIPKRFKKFIFRTISYDSKAKFDSEKTIEKKYRWQCIRSIFFLRKSLRSRP